MTAGPHILTPSEDAPLKEAAAAFLDVAEVRAITIYGPDGVANLNDQGRVVLLLSLSVQALVSPEAFRVNSVEMDFVARGMGLGLGGRCAASGFSEAQMARLLQSFHRGFTAGYEEQTRATEAMPTQGGKN